MVFDSSKPVQTRDGRKARIICTDAVGDYPIRYLTLSRNGLFETSGSATSKGWQDCDRRSEELDGDLINIPETHEAVIFQHKSSGGRSFYVVTNDSGNAIASKLVTFTEGEFEEEQGT